MSNRRDIQFTYNPHNKATVLDCSFLVEPSDQSSTGIRSLKGSGRIQSVYMNVNTAAATPTSTFSSGVSTITVSSSTGLLIGQVISDTTTPAAIAAGTTIVSISGTSIGLSQPTATASGAGDTLSAALVPAYGVNIEAGVIVVNLQDNYNRYLSGYAGFVSPSTGGLLTAMTAGYPYIIASVGSSSLAQWAAVGVPANIVPAVGVSFIGNGTSLAGGDHVIAVGNSGIDHIEVIGDANLMNSNGAYVAGAGNGMQIILQCFKNTALTAPTTGTVIAMNFYMNNSAQGV
jgi:hypothetical protein